MNSFYRAINSGDFLSATHYYNEASLEERICLFLSIITKKSDRLFEMLLPLTPSDIEIVKRAILNHNDRVMRELHRESYNSTYLSFVAASCGNIGALRYLHEHGCPIDEEAVNISVLYCHLNCLKYLVSIAKECVGYHTFAMAAKRSTYNSYGVPPKIRISKYTSLELEILQYLHDIGCIGDWDCKYKDRECHFCMNRKDIQLEELWIMYEHDYKNVVQWMPKEILDDVISLSI